MRFFFRFGQATRSNLGIGDPLLPSRDGAGDRVPAQPQYPAQRSQAGERATQHRRTCGHHWLRPRFVQGRCGFHVCMYCMHVYVYFTIMGLWMYVWMNVRCHYSVKSQLAWVCMYSMYVCMYVCTLCLLYHNGCMYVCMNEWMNTRHASVTTL